MISLWSKSSGGHCSCKSPGIPGCLPSGIGKIALILVLIYVGFYMLWGLNYSRLSFAEISGLPVEPAAVEELTELALALTEKANSLRAQVAENDRGVMTLSSGIRQMFAQAETGYQRAAEFYPELGGKYGPPKGVFLSRYWSYTGISGMYFPFTAEANVNIDIPILCFLQLRPTRWPISGALPGRMRPTFSVILHVLCIRMWNFNIPGRCWR